jgi:hypothetical protein
VTPWPIETDEVRFLWVRLQIDTICEAKQVRDLEKALEELPNGLADTYETVFRRIRNQREHSIVLTDRVFSWLLYPCANMPGRAIAYAVSTDPEYGHTEIADVDLILDVCQNLVRYDSDHDELALISCNS